MMKEDVKSVAIVNTACSNVAQFALIQTGSE